MSESTDSPGGFIYFPLLFLISFSFNSNFRSTCLFGVEHFPCLSGLKNPSYRKKNEKWYKLTFTFLFSPGYSIYPTKLNFNAYYEKLIFLNKKAGVKPALNI